MASDTTIRDRTGEYVRIICRNSCRRGQTVRARLQRSEAFKAQATPGQHGRTEYAGHLAICPHCGYEAFDFYNWTPA